jgi:hypothetical protein
MSVPNARRVFSTSESMVKGRAKVFLRRLAVVLWSASPLAAHSCQRSAPVRPAIIQAAATAPRLPPPGQRLPKTASARPATTRAAAIVLARETLATPCTGSALARWATTRAARTASRTGSASSARFAERPFRSPPARFPAFRLVGSPGPYKAALRSFLRILGPIPDRALGPKPVKTHGAAGFGRTQPPLS